MIVVHRLRLRFLEGLFVTKNLLFFSLIRLAKIFGGLLRTAHERMHFGRLPFLDRTNRHLATLRVSLLFHSVVTNLQHISEVPVLNIGQVQKFLETIR